MTEHTQNSKIQEQAAALREILVNSDDEDQHDSRRIFSEMGTVPVSQDVFGKRHASSSEYVNTDDEGEQRKSRTSKQLAEERKLVSQQHLVSDENDPETY